VKIGDFEEEVDQVFVAAEDGDCKRAWTSFDRAEIEAAKTDVPGAERKLTALQRQLLRRCPAKTGRAVEEERLGIIEPGDFLILAGLAILATAAVLSRRGSLTGYSKPGNPDDRFWHPWRYAPSGPPPTPEQKARFDRDIREWNRKNPLPNLGPVIFQGKVVP
jgi:hypothetical protein